MRRIFSLIYVMVSIIGLLVILVFCSCQTIDAYPQGGGAIASFAAGIFGHGSAFFYIFQIATVIILSLAANTAFALSRGGFFTSAARPGSGCPGPFCKWRQSP